ncbi:MAG: PTS transporter subunit EIIA [Desulfobacteraceae bacterium]|nr:PTS sugar transporter subunit IIA [Desulfobacteraceae bacterium]MBC2754163.1 PTS transporter subunit EIIA [Desulfobacteraceae bacterium]
MKLQLKELAAALNITPTTAERWIRQGRIPVRIKENHCVFSLASLKKWADANSLTYTSPGAEIQQVPENPVDNLHAAMERGGVYYNIEGGSVEEVITAGVNSITCFDTQGQRESLHESLLAREELMSTGIGKGVAIPHPRTPLDYGEIPAFITTCFLKNPVDYKSVDRQPVLVLFFLICPSSKRHLHLLARLSFCLREEEFIKFLNQIPDPAAFFKKIAELDQRFDAP